MFMRIKCYTCVVVPLRAGVVVAHGNGWACVVIGRAFTALHTEQ